MKWGIEESVLEKIYNALKEFEDIKEVWIFGSRARGDFKPTSDIDLALIKHSIDFETLLKLKSKFEQLPILYKVDVLDFKTLENTNLKTEIEKQARVFYRK